MQLLNLAVVIPFFEKGAKGDLRCQAEFDC